MNSSMSQFSILKNSDLQEYSGGLNPTCGVLVGMSIYIGLTALLVLLVLHCDFNRWASGR